MSRQKLNDATEQWIVRLHLEGKTRLQIQVATGVSQPTIRRVLKDHGYEIKDMGQPTRVTKELRTLIIDLRNKGANYETIAKRAGLSKRTVMNIVKDNAVAIKGHGEAIGPELFIRTWQENDSLMDVAVELGMPVTKVAGRAYQYRQRGVPLKHYKYSRSGYNWDELKEFAELFSETPESNTLAE